jgi:uncharacterized membrane protein (GlpM family)
VIGELLFRFVVGGALVAAFAMLGDLFSPKSFAGLFAGAPSVALATLALTVGTEGSRYARLEARSMVWGAVAFFAYAAALSVFLHRRKVRPMVAALAWLPLWFVLAAGGLALVLRAA